MPKFDDATVTTVREINEPEINTSTTIDVRPADTSCSQLYIMSYIQIGLVVLVVLVGIAVFIKSISSRKKYRCPVCNESFKSEHMESLTCKVCGAELEEYYGSEISDKTK